MWWVERCRVRTVETGYLPERAQSNMRVVARKVAFMNRLRLIRLVAVSAMLILVGSAATVTACNIPVFRYALENWQPDPYQVLVISRGSLDEQQMRWVETLRNASKKEDKPANLDVYELNLAEKGLDELLQDDFRQRRAPAWAIEQLRSIVERTRDGEARLLVLYPHVWDRVAWDTTLTAERVEQLVDSPLRQEIASRLLDGQSAVWVLVESGDRAADDAAWQVLERELERSKSVVKLPAQELIESDDEYRPEVEIELRVDFSAVRLAASDAREQAFAAMLRGSESDLSEFQGPLAVPIYGRGRTYYALVGDGIQARTIEDNGHFLCGACSCQVKQENPGVDMLMAVNWNAHIKGSAMPEIVLPELTGIGALEMVAIPEADQGTAVSDGSTRPSRTAKNDRVGDSTTSASDDDSPAGTAAVAAQPDERKASATATTEAWSSEGAVPTVSGQDAAAHDEEHAIGAGDHREEASANKPFSQRLLFVVAGGVCVTLAILAGATFWIRGA